MELQIYQSGNPWQRKAYTHLSEYLTKKSVHKYGMSDNGNSYRHLLRIEDGVNKIMHGRLD